MASPASLSELPALASMSATACTSSSLPTTVPGVGTQGGVLLLGGVATGLGMGGGVLLRAGVATGFGTNPFSPGSSCFLLASLNARPRRSACFVRIATDGSAMAVVH